MMGIEGRHSPPFYLFKLFFNSNALLYVFLKFLLIIIKKVHFYCSKNIFSKNVVFWEFVIVKISVDNEQFGLYRIESWFKTNDH
jgi:hypothetical protein